MIAPMSKVAMIATPLGAATRLAPAPRRNQRARPGGGGRGRTSSPAQRRQHGDEPERPQQRLLPPRLAPAPGGHRGAATAITRHPGIARVGLRSSSVRPRYPRIDWRPSPPRKTEYVYLFAHVIH